MTAFVVNHPSFDKPRLVEARHHKQARAHVGRELEVRPVKGAKEIFDLAEQGVELQTAGRKENGDG